MKRLSLTKKNSKRFYWGSKDFFKIPLSMAMKTIVETRRKNIYTYNNNNKMYSLGIGRNLVIFHPHTL
jgi:hypothetical protein